MMRILFVAVSAVALPAVALATAGAITNVAFADPGGIRTGPSGTLGPGAGPREVPDTAGEAAGETGIGHGGTAGPGAARGIPGPPSPHIPSPGVQPRGGPPGGDGTAAEVPGGTGAPSAFGRYRSYEANPNLLTGSVGNSFAADSLIGAEVVAGDGTRLGEVRDILIDDRGNARWAAVERGGFLGAESRTVAVDLRHLRMEEGSGRSLVTSLSERQITASPPLERVDGAWRRRNTP